MPQAYSNAFKGPNLAEIDRSAYSNSLMRNDVARLPQRNRAEDVQMQAQEQAIGAEQKATAAGLLAQRFSAVASSPTPKAAAQQFLTDPNFQAAGRLVGLPVEQFTVADTDTDDALRQSAMDWANALGQGGQQRRVQSTHVLEDGTIAIVESDGTIRRTNERARNDLRYVESGGGRGAFDPRTGEVAPITTAAQETSAAADRAGAEAWARAAATAGVDLQKEQVGRQGTLGVWRVAREGLLRGLRGTETGPISGRIPAVTAGQQIAEGGVAAVAPVLKALFRSAGEGVFTDRDQQLLIDMIPSRTDHPETITSKMQMIDAIIEAKLAAPTGLGGLPSIVPNRPAVPQSSSGGWTITEIP